MKTEYLDRDEGKIAYDVTGRGSLVICVPSMGDVRAEYRFLAPDLARCGLHGRHDGSARPRRVEPDVDRLFGRRRRIRYRRTCAPSGRRPCRGDRRLLGWRRSSMGRGRRPRMRLPGSCSWTRSCAMFRH